MALENYPNYMQINVYEVGIADKAKDFIQAIKGLQNSADTFRANNTDSLAKTVVGFPKTLMSAYEKIKPVLEDAEVLNYTLENKLTTLTLPMPNTITDSYTQKYDESTYNAEQRLASTSIGVLQSMVGLVSTSVASTIPTIVDMTEHLMERGNLSVSPNNLMVYSGSVPRSFNMDFNLTVSNKPDAEFLNNTIFRLRYYSTAELADRKVYQGLGIRTLSVGNCFNFSFHSRTPDKGNPADIDFMNLLIYGNSNSEQNNKVAFYLSGINLIIDGNDAMQIYYDGTPKMLRLSLSFIERKPLYSADWFNHIYSHKLGVV